MNDARSLLTAQLPVRRELLILALALLCGVLVLPLLIWFVGQLILGPYDNGGMAALFADFLSGLAGGSPAFWIVALGPYVLTQFIRGVMYVLRRTAPAED